MEGGGAGRWGKRTERKGSRDDILSHNDTEERRERQIQERGNEFRSGPYTDYTYFIIRQLHYGEPWFWYSLVEPLSEDSATLQYPLPDPLHLEAARKSGVPLLIR